MPFNWIIVGFALAALALDKLSIFDDETANYVNVPVYQPSTELKPPSRTSTSVQPNRELHSSRQSPSTSGNPRRQPAAENAFDDKGAPHKYPAVNQVVLGAMVVPADY